MLEIFLPIMIAVFGAIMLKRITEKPFRVGFNVVETAANTFTDQDIELPVAVITQGQGQATIQAIEVMKIIYEINEPSPEAGQNNNVLFSLTRDAVTTIPALDSDNTIDRVFLRSNIVEVTAVGEIVSNRGESQVPRDLTDGDGNGQIVLERRIHANILGSGNSAAKRGQGYMLCHLIELDAAEAIVQSFLDND